MHTIQRTLLALAVTAALPAWGHDMDMPGMQMPGMDMPSASAPAPAAAPASAMAPAHDTPADAPAGHPPGMDMPGMEMSGKAAAAPAPAAAAQGMDMHGMDMSGKPAAAQTGPRSASADSGGYTLTTGPYIPAGVRPEQLLHRPSFGSVLIDRLERAWGGDSGNWTAYDVQAWYGQDFNRLVLKAEGQVSRARLQESRTELLWGHAIAAYWDTQLGVRHDQGGGPDRNWLAFGVQGLAPYWFDIEATAYVGDQGRSVLRLNAGDEWLLTQRVVLQPRVEANLYGKDDPQRGIGIGQAPRAGVR